MFTGLNKRRILHCILYSFTVLLHYTTSTEDITSSVTRITTMTLYILLQILFVKSDYEINLHAKSLNKRSNKTKIHNRTCSKFFLSLINKYSASLQRLGILNFR